jgi:hypothetical protein
VSDILCIKKEESEDKREDDLEQKENKFGKRETVIIKKEDRESAKLQPEDIRYDSEGEIMDVDCKEEIYDNPEWQNNISTYGSQKFKYPIDKVNS